ncbi:MAG: metallopeptidase TldD-related protein, partial [Acidobacteriota bacterium]
GPACRSAANYDQCRRYWCETRSNAYREGYSFVRQHLGSQVFDARFDLVDDATSERGLPFPFDLEGRRKQRVDLVARGVPRTPTVDSQAAQEFQLEPTGHAVGGGDAYALNLFMEPGTASSQELLETADGGLWISRLERIECFDLGRMLLRTVARGVRRIQGGQLAQPLPDLVWNDSLLRVFSRLEAVGQEHSVKVSRDGVLGGTSAPSIVLPGVEGLVPSRR